MKCQFCDKEYSKLSSLKSHERFCSKNPNKAVNPHTGKPGKNQYTKARELSLKVPENGNKIAALRKYLETPFENLGIENQRRRVFEDQNHKCNNCGRAKWCGQPIILELEHKDGNHGNNARGNLEGLCPNCHSMSPTWRGRNKGNHEVTDDELLEALTTMKSIRQVLLKVGLSAKGGNYHRVYALQNPRD